ncbi:MAG TPA: pyruvate formate lyase-activating protein [Pelotomaculum sp.]|mgnify:CR=1 FL=1|nr:pyruvate formate lyase-activating protein [Pelotomaculum sp.]
MIGYIHSIETMGTVDNGGIRFVLFLQGCGLRCSFCHNPDTWLASGKPVEAAEIIEQLKSYKTFFELSGGGLTVSGGEPLLQSGFVKELFIEAGKLGIHRALDTAGYCKRGDLQEVLPHTDQVLFSLKVVDPEKHRQLTERENVDIIKNLRMAAESQVQLVVCYVLIPGVNDAPEDAQALADLLKSLHGEIPVDVLAYSKLGADKWEEMGLCDPMAGVAPATQKQVELFQSGLRRLGVRLYHVRRWGNLLDEEGRDKFAGNSSVIHIAE